MCTVTIVPKADTSGAFRMACSRDEQHSRAPAHPPQQRGLEGVQTLMPIDPASDGTWVGVNAQGLAMTLLNYNLVAPPTDGELSRGSVIPQLLLASSVDEVAVLAASIQASRMMPFRLVACDGRSVMLWRSTEPIEQAQVVPWSNGPIMWTSSGLGDHLVEAPRRELFDGWFSEGAAAYLSEQQAFHRHQWPGREHLSVCMHRDDARTVSYTVVDVDPTTVTMAYHPDRPDRDAPQHIVSLQR